MVGLQAELSMICANVQRLLRHGSSPAVGTRLAPPHPCRPAHPPASPPAAPTPAAGRPERAAPHNGDALPGDSLHVHLQLCLTNHRAPRLAVRQVPVQAAPGGCHQREDTPHLRGWVGWRAVPAGPGRCFCGAAARVAGARHVHCCRQQAGKVLEALPSLLPLPAPHACPMPPIFPLHCSPLPP